jgi:hypothetical protein
MAIAIDTIIMKPQFSREYSCFEKRQINITVKIIEENIATYPL